LSLTQQWQLCWTFGTKTTGKLGQEGTDDSCDIVSKTTAAAAATTTNNSLFLKFYYLTKY
jgi:hypothetical protein